MAYIRCGGGGGMTETVLWTNSSPTSSYSTGTPIVSSMTGYDFIKIVYRKSTSNTTEISFIVPLSTFKNMTNTSGSNYLGAGYRDTNSYCRPTYYSSATVVSFSNCTRLGASGNSNTNLIPYKVIGIKI